MIITNVGPVCIVRRRDNYQGVCVLFASREEVIITSVGPVCIVRRRDNYQRLCCLHREKK